MLRKDASLFVADDTTPGRDSEINEELESHPVFSKKYWKILDLMKFHASLSHLRPQLETAIQGAESVVIHNDNIVAFK